MEMRTALGNLQALPWILGALGLVSAAVAMVPVPVAFKALLLWPVLLNATFALVMAVGVVIGVPAPARPNVILLAVGILAFKTAVYLGMRLLMPIPAGGVFPIFRYWIYGVASLMLQAVAVLFGAALGARGLVRPRFIAIMLGVGLWIGAVLSPILTILMVRYIGSYMAVFPASLFAADALFGLCLGFFLRRTQIPRLMPDIVFS
jgi:hypothetical protein